MRDRQGITMVSTAVSGTVNIPFNSNRNYLALIVAADTTVTISGGEPFLVLAGNVWSPIPAPINDIEFIGTATLVIG